jgi:hypothetical protein
MKGSVGSLKIEAFPRNSSEKEACRDLSMEKIYFKNNADANY